MKQNLYAVYDDKAQAYNAPFPLSADGLAIRAFREACADERTDLHKYPCDYRLYRIGTFDPSTGALDTLVPAVLLADNSKQN